MICYSRKIDAIFYVAEEKNTNFAFSAKTKTTVEVAVDFPN